MGEYFKPLRRKFGVLTLAFACLFAVGWVRSHSKVDVIETGAGFSSYRFISGIGYLYCILHHPEACETHFKYFALKRRGNKAVVSVWPDPEPMVFKHEIAGCSFGGWVLRQPIIPRATVYSYKVEIPYLWITLPLALVSCWLLLSKPRSPRTATPAIEHA